MRVGLSALGLSGFRQFDEPQAQAFGAAPVQPEGSRKHPRLMLAGRM